MQKTITEQFQAICKEQNIKPKECISAMRAVAIALNQVADAYEKENQNEKPDFTTIKDGEHFTYKGIEFVRLGEEQGGVLCVTAKLWKKEIAFDKDNCNNWAKSSIRKTLNSKFLALLNSDDLLLFESDLIADNGDTAYGKCTDKVGLLSCDLFRKYRKYVPRYDDWAWTCTPWSCDASYAHGVRNVYPSGVVNGSIARDAYGVAPACIFSIK